MEKLAELARIELTDEEKESLLGDFDSILAYIDMIKNIEVGDIREGSDLHNAWREDEMADRDFSKELLTGQFPESHAGFLKVKKIL